MWNVALLANSTLRMARNLPSISGWNTASWCVSKAFLRRNPLNLQLEALEPTLVYAMPKHRLEEVALHNVNIQILYRKILEESLIISQVHADMLRFETAQDRYLKLL